MPKRLLRTWNGIAAVAERTIAMATLLASLVFSIGSIIVLIQMDWTLSETFYTFIDRALIVIIGLELVRMLVNHSIGAVLELLAFVIARKMLHPELTSVDVALGSLAFVALMAARHFLMEENFYRDKFEEVKEEAKQEMKREVKKEVRKEVESQVG